MKICVTGAAGFIGSHLCEKLLGQDHAVIGIDNFNDFYDPEVKRNNIAIAAGHNTFNLCEADIRDQKNINTIFQEHELDSIIHLAAMAGVRPSIENPSLYQDVNMNGTTVMLEAARKFKIDRFVFASSSSVYGNNRKVPFAETDNVDYPISPYASTKKSGELLCHTYHHLFGINISCLRFFTVYGPRQRPDLAIHKFARLMEANQPIPVFGDGSMSRDYTYIDDITDGIIASMNNCMRYSIYNLGNSNPIQLSELIVLLEEALGRKAMINRLPQQPGDVDRTYADITQAEQKLGYQPHTDIREGLKAFVEWLRQC